MRRPSTRYKPRQYFFTLRPRDRICIHTIHENIYTYNSVTVYLHKVSEKINIKRGVRQGDTISPKLFTSTLESIFRRLNWENKGLKIDGEYLNHLRFADDIFLCTETPQTMDETGSLTKQTQKKLAAAQTKMERSMLNITYHDRKTNTWVRAKTGVTEVIKTRRRIKWSWAGHISRLKYDRWTKRITTWRPYGRKKLRGRPATRWRDDLDESE